MLYLLYASNYSLNSLNILKLIVFWRRAPALLPAVTTVPSIISVVFIIIKVLKKGLQENYIAFFTSIISSFTLIICY